MKQKIIHLTTKKETIPLIFNLNVMEEIQGKYGTMDEWGRLTDGEVEPSIKDIKFGLLAMVNEAIDIENEEKEENKPFITSKHLGRFITDFGFENLIGEVKQLTTDSVDSGVEEAKNM